MFALNAAGVTVTAFIPPPGVAPPCVTYQARASACFAGFSWVPPPSVREMDKYVAHPGLQEDLHLVRCLTRVRMQPRGLCPRGYVHFPCFLFRSIH